MENFSLNLIIYLHKFFIYFLFGGFLLPDNLLLIHVMAWPLTIISWSLNNNNCIFTQLENYIELGIWSNKSNQGNEFKFISNFISENFYINVDKPDNRRSILKFLYLMFTIAWVISVTRYISYINRKKIKPIPV